MKTNQPLRILDEEFVPAEGALAKNFVSNVFSWMVIGLLITAFVAWYAASNGLYVQLVGAGGLMRWVILLAPFGFIIAMNAGLQKYSATTLTMMFIAFSATMGLSLSSVFLIYSMGSITQVFFITAGTFAVMAFAGYTTKMDLSKLGSLLFMALIGIIIASVVNWFMHSAMMDFIISVAGVLIFTGLVAYDTQRIKRIGAGVEYGTAGATKLAILAAVSLYLNFINLFLFLLRLLGGRD
ncbi:MAG TPA: Bax inhibitor-1/YccA family protein [Flavobacteriales bacterium]|nr:Bax inhibitor-1/YccA family protein [Flavobacteriales bacterium]HIN41091.1 Bax inhibitor-1/YccA family protein [Flavobacteriales bacterium]HIO16639.1 Bax inhibitor-1/YccA family protein [Flavobacteriales bacterium]